MQRRFAVPFGLVCALAAPGSALAAGPTITEFPTPSAQCLPQGLDIAADGSVYYTETNAGKIARLKGEGLTREYALPGGSAPAIVKVDGDFVWYTDYGGFVGRLDPRTGAVVRYPLPSGNSPNFLQIAPDGSKWFSEPSGVGRLDPSGTVTEWEVTLEQGDSHIEQISIDPSGKVWFTELNYDGTGPAGTNFVRRLDPATNVVRAYPVPTFGGTPAGVVAVTADSVWVSEYWAGDLALLDVDSAPYTSVVVSPNTTHSASQTIGAVSPGHFNTGHATTSVTATSHVVAPVATPGWIAFTIPTAGANAEDMRVDEDGRLFFEEDGGVLGVLEPWSGHFTEYPIPSPDSGYYNIEIDRGDIWFTEAGAFGPVATKLGHLKR